MLSATMPSQVSSSMSPRTMTKSTPTSSSPSTLDRPTISYMRTLHLSVFRTSETPWRSMGQYKYRILESGSTTQDRLSVVESLIPPKSHGPIFHFHEMHDETFYVTRGVVCFHCPGRKSVDIGEGDMIVVPTRLPHRFSNPFEQEAVFVSMNTPSHYARYFEVLEELIGEGMELTPEVNVEAMRRFATVPLGEADLEVLKKELAVDGEGNGLNGKANGGAFAHEKEGGEGWKVLE